MIFAKITFEFKSQYGNIPEPILESKSMIFQKKVKKILKKDKKWQNIWKFGQKCTKFESIF